MKRYLFVLLVFVFAAGGCTLAPPYESPPPPVPEAWPDRPADTQGGTPAVGTAAADIAWRDFISDAYLRKVVATAMENNRDLRLAALNVQRARALYGIQRSTLFPSLNATANYSEQRVPADLSASGESMTVDQYDVNLGIFGWEIDFFGRIRSLKDQALETFLATTQARRSAQILIVSSVADAYLAVAASRENLNLAQDTLRTQQEVYDLINRRYNAGLVSELDLNRARTQVAAARSESVRYQRQSAQAENALGFLVGSFTAVAAGDLPSNVTGLKPFEPVSAGVSSSALLQRPDILQAEHLLKAAHANIGAARAALFPRIALTTAIGTASSELSGLFDSGSETWRFAPQISLPVFDARLWSALDATKTEREIVLIRYEKAIQTAFREVADALAVQATVDRQLSAQQSLAASAAETYRLAKARYEKGIDSYLGVLDAQRSLYTARQGLVGLYLLKLSNQMRLYATLGGGGD